jgi:hypothetical protein
VTNRPIAGMAPEPPGDGPLDVDELALVDLEEIA